MRHPDVAAWASTFQLLASADDTTWFLAADDYGTGSTGAFAWNEFEKISLDGADAEQAAAVAEFWSRHLPLAMSVRDGYAYLAARDDGAIVRGDEPEFEATEVVAADLPELLRDLAQRSTSAGAVRVASMLGLDDPPG